MPIHELGNSGSDISPAHGIRVLAVDDHPLLLEGIASVLAVAPDVELVGEASDGAEAIERFRELRPDITLMDIQMRGMGGIEATEAIVREFPQARIVVLTTYEGDGSEMRALRAGAFGFLVKSCLRRDLVATLRSVHAGHRSVAPSVKMALRVYGQAERLTTRELDVLRLVADGNSNRRVGEYLAIGEETVKSYMKNIMQKLCANDRAHAVAIGIRFGLLPTPGMPLDTNKMILKTR
jgi:DNA-binding NarL/FixJ family response regulator